MPTPPPGPYGGIVPPYITERINAAKRHRGLIVTLIAVAILTLIAKRKGS